MRNDWYGTLYTIRNDVLGMRIDIEQQTGRISYHYIANMGSDSEIGFNFDMLCEVGANWQEPFRQMMADHGIVAEGYYNPSDNHGHGCYDRMVLTPYISGPLSVANGFSGR